MKNPKISALSRARMAVFCCLTVVMLCSAFVATGQQAFAANNPHLTTNQHQVKSKVIPLNSFTDVIGPGKYFLGCGTGWNWATDGTESFFYAYTTGSQACSKAVWDDHARTQNQTCDVITYIPTILATANNLAYRFYNSSNQEIAMSTINQNDVYGWEGLVFGVYGIHHVVITSDNGEWHTYMAASVMQFACY